MEDKKYFHELEQGQKNLPAITYSNLEQVEGPVPLFIVGMPRSGTTLIEQILSCHSEVHAAGELDILELVAGGIVCDQQATVESLLEARRKYLDHISKLSPGAAVVTDKMPLNFRFIGLIFALFPEAKIIHVKRDARATCWSNYKHYFGSERLGYSFDLSDLVSYYKLYRNLTKRLTSTHPGRVYELNYDKLVIEQTAETKKLVHAIGLSWQEECLSRK